MLYSDEDFLQLSGIQHFSFCKRQWALIHIEQIWTENVLTTEGKHLHERVDDPFFDETRGHRRVVRSMPLECKILGFQGIADVVEFINDSGLKENEGVKLDGKEGIWRPFPVEYKRGKPKKDECDEVQLCAQALALEEMMEIHINEGAIFYAQTRHRELIRFTDVLRNRVSSLFEEMHSLFEEGRTPSAVYCKSCNSCSIFELCQPRLTSKWKSVDAYIAKMIE